MDIISRFEGSSSQKLIQRLAWITAGWTYFLVALGGTVRVNNAGLSCPDWPLCYGRIFSMESIGALLEESHRYTASIVSVLVIFLVLAIVLWARRDKILLRSGIIAICLLVVQIILGGLTVLWKLEGPIITSHLATAQAFFATILFLAVMAGKKMAEDKEMADDSRSPEAPCSAMNCADAINVVPMDTPDKSGLSEAGRGKSSDRRFARLAVINAVLVYVLLLTGSYVFNSGASLACPGWPLCGNAPEWAVRYHLSDINLLHRGVAILIGLVMMWTLFSVWQRRKVARDQAAIAITASILFLIQSGVGGLVVLWKKPIYIADLHLALATAVWACMVILASMAVRRILVTSDLKPIPVSAMPVFAEQGTN